MPELAHYGRSVSAFLPEQVCGPPLHCSAASTVLYPIPGRPVRRDFRFARKRNTPPPCVDEGHRPGRWRIDTKRRTTDVFSGKSRTIVMPRRPDVQRIIGRDALSRRSKTSRQLRAFRVILLRFDAAIGRESRKRLFFVPTRPLVLERRLPTNGRVRFPINARVPNRGLLRERSSVGNALKLASFDERLSYRRLNRRAWNRYTSRRATRRSQRLSRSLRA